MIYRREISQCFIEWVRQAAGGEWENSHVMGAANYIHSCSAPYAFGPQLIDPTDSTVLEAMNIFRVPISVSRNENTEAGLDATHLPSFWAIKPV